MKTQLIILLASMLGIPAFAMSSGNLPLEIITTRAVFPREAALRGVDYGYARVAIEVSPNGNLIDHLVTECSEKEFAQEAGKLVTTASYRVPADDGQPTAVRTNLLVEFETSGLIISSDWNEIVESYLHGRQIKRTGFSLKGASEIDAAPQLVNAVKPVYPTDWAERGISGRVLIDFYIDETGAVRLPAIASADFDELGTVALDAVRQWTFAVPRHYGEPVSVHVKQVFEFNP